MIEITHVQCLNGGEITIKGHAGAAAYGEDVVCAAVSAITTTLAKLMEPKANVRLQSGEGRIAYPCGKDTAPYIHFAMTGYRWMAERFPEFILLLEMKELEEETEA